ncbi:MAG: hypothetical protein LBR60_00865 [Fibrobacter sp.]|jgi:hypothetical protein|nr:hypothetical protein [Fibrobacter sp.]
MNEPLNEQKLPIIEVPAELRGLSDEEILSLDFGTSRRTRHRIRPSKRERDFVKKAQEDEKIRKIAEEYESEKKSTPGIPPAPSAPGFSKPMPKLSDFENKPERPLRKEDSKPGLFFRKREGKELFSENPLEKKDVVTPKSSISTPPKPSTGRVLKLSFGGVGGKGLSGVKGTIVSAEEAAKANIKEAPVKRGRGRPPKNRV